MSIGHQMPEDRNLQKVCDLQAVGGFEDGGVIDSIIH
jgi:hypothetical protein